MASAEELKEFQEARAKRDAEIEAMRLDGERMKAELEGVIAQVDKVEATWRANLAAAGLDADDVLALSDAVGTSDLVAYHHRKSNAAGKPGGKPKPVLRHARMKI